MPGPGFQLDCLLDPRLSPHAASPRPIWLWSADAHRILWANPTGAAIFGAASPAAAAALEFPATHPAASQIARLATSLTDNGAPRLERLRGFGARGAAMLTCACSRITLAGGEKAVLIVSTERAGPDLSLAERAQRLLTENDAPVAAFAADGTLLYATAPIAQSLNGVTSLDAIDAATLAAQASREGTASGSTKIGVLSLARIGEGASTVLLATLDHSTSEATAETPIVEDRPAHDDAAVTPPAAEADATATETAATEPAAIEPAAPEPVAHTPETPRHPLRFVWALDDQGRFTLESQEFIALIGQSTAQILHRPWNEIAATLKLDPDGSVARAFASHETFSGLIVPWPVDGSSETMPIELSGLPMFDRERRFRGYRGFGICRDVERLDALATARALLDAQPASPSILPPAEPPKATEPPPNVLRFPAQPGQAQDNAQDNAEAPADVFAAPANPGASPTPTLTPVEKLAFRELARRLGDGLKQPQKIDNDSAPPPVAPPAPLAAPTQAPRSRSEAPILDRLPFGILVYRLNELLYANKAFLDWTGYAGLYDLVQAGGLDTLFIDTSDATSAQNGTPLTISTQDGDHKPVDGRLFSTTWNDESALVLMLNTGLPMQAPAAPDPRLAETEQAL
ncbi:MAG: PAS domain-containing protein, partial [Pseudolabrys sp.]